MPDLAPEQHPVRIGFELQKGIENDPCFPCDCLSKTVSQEALHGPFLLLQGKREDTNAVSAYTRGPCVQTHTLYFHTKATLESGEMITNGTHRGNRKQTLPTSGSGREICSRSRLLSDWEASGGGWRAGCADTAQFYTQYTPPMWNHCQSIITGKQGRPEQGGGNGQSFSAGKGKLVCLTWGRGGGAQV